MGRRAAIGSRAVIALYVLVMVALVVGVDVLFLRHQFRARLMVNVGIVLVFGAFYFMFLKGRLDRGQPAH